MNNINRTSSMFQSSEDGKGLGASGLLGGPLSAFIRIQELKRKPVITFYQDNKKEWRWDIKHGNGKITGASSEGYKNKIDAVKNLMSVGNDIAELCQVEINEYSPLIGGLCNMMMPSKDGKYPASGLLGGLGSSFARMQQMKRRAIFKFYEDNRKEWRWEIKHENGKIIGASSEGYKNRIDSVKNLMSVGKDIIEFCQEEINK